MVAPLMPSISFDGTFVAYSSIADNLVDDDNNGVEDIFVYNTLTGNVKRVSVANQ